MFTFIAFAAGLVRGYSGFGFAMLMALGLMLQLPPAEAVPVALILDVACSVTLWPAALRAVHGRVLVRLLMGMLLAVPLGAWLLLWLPAHVMAPLVAVLCLCGGVLVLWLPSIATPVGQGMAWLAGLASGLATTLASAGGPPPGAADVNYAGGPAARAGLERPGQQRLSRGNQPAVLLGQKAVRIDAIARVLQREVGGHCIRQHQPL